MERREAIKNTVLFLGYSVSFSALSETFLACNKAAGVDWQPVFLSKTQANTVAEITETILPKTETPGAKDLGVPQFVDKMLKDLLSEEDQKGFVADLDQFEKDCKAAYGKAFVDCDQTQREEYLVKLDKESAKFPPSAWGIALVESPPPVTFFQKIEKPDADGLLHFAGSCTKYFTLRSRAWRVHCLYALGRKECVERVIRGVSVALPDSLLRRLKLALALSL